METITDSRGDRKGSPDHAPAGSVACSGPKTETDFGEVKIRLRL
jgi:hypothetical protein